MRSHTATLSVCATLLAVAAFSDVRAAPIQETKTGITVVHGGVSADDRARIEQQADDYNLALTFARKGSGAYLADVKVVVRNKQGATVIDTIASGPLLLARLPEGEYDVSASEGGGTTLTHRIAIKGKARHEWVFRFELPPGAAPEFDAGK